MKKAHISLAERIECYFLSFVSTVLTFFNLKALYKNTHPLILCYHSIGSNDWRFTSGIKEFEKQIQYLTKNKQNISLSNILKKDNDLHNLVSITFDDGYKNLHTNVLPLFNKLGLKGTLFILSDSNKPNRDELQNNLELLSEAEIKDFIKSGWEIGSHTSTHADLRTLSDEELEEEIINSKKKLEKKYSIKIRYFAYPRGIYSKRIISYVKKAKYECAFTVDGGDVKNNTNPYLQSRLAVEKLISIHQFTVLTSNLGIKFYVALMILLKSKEQIQTAFKKFFQGKTRVGLNLPSTIDEYKLISSTNIDKIEDDCVYALYQNRGKKIAFAKCWIGKNKNQTYHELTKEINTYQKLKGVFNHEHNLHSKVRVPKMLKIVKNPNLLMLFLENVEGFPLETFPVNKQVLIINEATRFLKKLNVNSLRVKIYRKTPAYWIKLLLFRTPIACFRNPAYTFSILKGLYVFFNHVKPIMNDKSMQIVHRDIGEGNIIIAKNIVWIIDLQHMCISGELIEHAAIMHKMWRVPDFNSLYASSGVMEKILADINNLRVFKAYIILFAIYHLSLPKNESTYSSYDCLIKMTQSLLPANSAKGITFQEEYI